MTPSRGHHLVLLGLPLLLGAGMTTLCQHSAVGPETARDRAQHLAIPDPARPAAVAPRREVVERNSVIRGLLHPQRGQEMIFDIGFVNSTERSDSAGEGTRRLAIEGTLRIVVTDARAEELVLQVDFSAAHPTLWHGEGRSEMDFVGDELTAPALVRITTGGELLGLRAAPEVSEPTQSAIHQIVQALWFVVPDPARATWSSVESEDLGSFDVRYVWRESEEGMPRGLERHRTACLAVNGPWESLSLAGSSRATFDDTLGFWTRVERDERTRGHTERGSIRQALRLTCELRTARRCPQSLPDPGWDHPWSTPRAPGVTSSTSQPAHLVEQIGTALNESGPDSLDTRVRIDELLDALESHPEMLDEIGAICRADDAAPELVEVLLQAVAAVGRTGEQRILTTLVADRNLSIETRASALRALAHLVDPEVPVLLTVDALLDEGDLPRSSTLSVLVAIGSRLGSSHAERVAVRVLAVDPPPTDTEDLTEWIDSIGQLAAVSARAALHHYLEDPRHEIRAAAREALTDPETER